MVVVNGQQDANTRVKTHEDQVEEHFCVCRFSFLLYCMFVPGPTQMNYIVAYLC